MKKESWMLLLITVGIVFFSYLLLFAKLLWEIWHDRNQVNSHGKSKSLQSGGQLAMRKYCDKCNQIVETKIVAKEETYDIRGESITVTAQVLVCAHCGEELFSEELDNATLVSAYNEYRKRHNLLFSEEIKQIREQYDLSQRSFARLLNWEDNTICRYETGSIQNEAHNSLLLFLRQPENMRTYLTENKVSLNAGQLRKLLETVDKLKQGEDCQSSKNFFNLFFTQAPCEENGFKAFDYDKFCVMVLYFAHKSPDLSKTKLAKLLNYSDMFFYKENGISISGTRYVHLPYGPVPENFDILFNMMATDHVAHINEKHQIIPDEDVPEEILSEEEMEAMERIYRKFENFGSVEISDYAYKEKGYMDTKKGEIISYVYAKDIELN